ncbi:MAG: hypothetical protein Tsb0016_11630 [Sphingomonadales bacterium]
MAAGEAASPDTISMTMNVRTRPLSASSAKGVPAGGAATGDCACGGVMAMAATFKTPVLGDALAVAAAAAACACGVGGGCGVSSLAGNTLPSGRADVSGAAGLSASVATRACNANWVALLLAETEAALAPAVGLGGAACGCAMACGKATR